MTTNDGERRMARNQNRVRVRLAQRRVTGAEVRLSDAIAARDKALIECHGDKREGLLTYTELAEETGLSKGRVIQIVQPHRTGQASA